MTVSSVNRQAVLATTVAVLLLSTSGCAWVKRKFTSEAPYQDSQVARPLEVPPGLDTPRASGNYALPDAAGLSSGAVSSLPPAANAANQAQGVSDFLVADTLDSTWRRLGLALARVDGASITSQAQLLNSYEVSYAGHSLLIRAETAGDQTRVSAVGADGKALSGGSAAQLLGLLKARLN